MIVATTAPIVIVAEALGTTLRIEIPSSFVDAIERLRERFDRANRVRERRLEELAARLRDEVAAFERATSRHLEERKTAYRAARQDQARRARAGTPALAARQYHRPRRVGRSCGSPHRVMLA